MTKLTLWTWNPGSRWVTEGCLTGCRISYHFVTGNRDFLMKLFRWEDSPYTERRDYFMGENELKKRVLKDGLKVMRYMTFIILRGFRNI